MNKENLYKVNYYPFPGSCVHEDAVVALDLSEAARILRLHRPTSEIITVEKCNVRPNSRVWTRHSEEEIVEAVDPRQEPLPVKKSY